MPGSPLDTLSAYDNFVNARAEALPTLTGEELKEVRTELGERGLTLVGGVHMIDAAGTRAEYAKIARFKPNSIPGPYVIDETYHATGVGVYAQI